ncbi:MAG: YfhO family protein, partial [Clostridia bacterium]|nr:YfhO family protein [Clostridia bacterium]
MNYSFEKKLVLKPQKEKGLQTFLIALLTAAAIFLPFMISDNGYFVFYGDFNAQQIPFYKMCHEAVKTGNMSWNKLTDLGANFVGSYSYYLLGSVFFWLTIPFPNSFVPYLMGPLLILKFACAALTAYLYIRRFTRTPESAQIGGLLYAFSGFSIYNIFFNSFHESIIIFPLLLLALELLITENRRGILAILVCLCAIVNYFFFFGMVVFTVIYYFVRVFSKAVKFKTSVFLALLFEAFIGVVMAAVLLLPSICALTGNARISNVLLGWSAITYGKEQIYLNIIQCFFFPPDIPARPVFFPGAEVRWSSLGGWLPLLSMTAVFTLFIHKKGSWLKRMLSICIFMSMIPILNSSFSAFNVSYYARWFYMPILMMCLASATLIEDETVDFTSGVKYTAAVTLFFALVIGFFPQKGEDGRLIFGLYTRGDDMTYAVRFWLTVAIAVVSLLVFIALLSVRNKNLKLFFRISTVAVCIISVVYSIIFISTGRTHSYDIQGIIIDDLIEGEVYLEDDSEYRIDTFDCVDNTGMYLGYSSINAFHSVVPSSISKFYDFLGIERSVASRPDTSLPALRSLLSVKYLLARQDGESFYKTSEKTKMPGYDFYKISDDYIIFENDNYIPYGFSYEYYFTEKDLEKYYPLDGDLKTKMMLKGVLIDEESVDKFKGILKHISERDDVVFQGTVENNYAFSDEAMSLDARDLAATSASSFAYDNNGFSATVQRDKESLVFFSVPFDDGWSAEVNGQKVEIEKVNKGFMAVVVPDGESVIRFTYNTPGLKTGAYISLVGFSVFLIYFIAASVFIKKYTKDTYYPEGKELILKWHKADIADSLDDGDSEEDTPLSKLGKDIEEYNDDFS